MDHSRCYRATRAAILVAALSVLFCSAACGSDGVDAVGLATESDPSSRARAVTQEPSAVSTVTVPAGNPTVDVGDLTVEPGPRGLPVRTGRFPLPEGVALVLVDEGRLLRVHGSAAGEVSSRVLLDPEAMGFRGIVAPTDRLRGLGSDTPAGSAGRRRL
jgi:hypothetical protein